ncbi:MAG: hypothetical protein HQL90_05965 [Magnetococcales bacterium]|nr:hypothetical protein [Magnetococcales bacterium]
MGKIVCVQLDENTSFLVESRLEEDSRQPPGHAGERGLYRAGRDTVAETAARSETVARALEVAAPVVQRVRDAFLAASPDECQLEFGLKLSAGAGTLFTEVGAEAHIKVTLKWQPAKPAS